MSYESINHLRMPSGPALRIFISHSSRDEAIVRWIVAQVKAAGHEAWVAEWDYRPGHSLNDKVATELRRSDAYILLLTEEGYDSIYVGHETGAAAMSGKPVIALVDKALGDRPLGMLTDVEQVRFDRDDLAASTAAIVAGLTNLSRSRGVDIATAQLIAPTQPAIFTMSVEMNAEFHVTAEQVLVGIGAVMLIAGLVYLASQE